MCNGKQERTIRVLAAFRRFVVNDIALGFERRLFLGFSLGVVLKHPSAKL